MKRSAPAVHVLIRRFESWNSVVVLLALISLISFVSWLIFSGAELSVMTLVPAVAGSVLVSTIALFTTIRRPATSLRWDGQSWYAGPVDLVGSEPWTVDVMVRIDLVSWMLLELRSDQIGFPPERVWLPMQRLGIETDWHALRCALFGRSNTSATDSMYRATSV